MGGREERRNRCGRLNFHSPNWFKKVGHGKESGVLVKVLQRKRTNRMCVFIERFILRNWLTEVWKLASPNSMGQVSRLETQGRGNIAARV